MIDLVVTADDFGVDLAVNEAIEIAHREGVLTGASLMVSGKAVGDAVTRAPPANARRASWRLPSPAGCGTAIHAGLTVPERVFGLTDSGHMDMVRTESAAARLLTGSTNSIYIPQREITGRGTPAIIATAPNSTR